MSLIVSTNASLDTSDATATASDILAGKTAYVDGDIVTGIIPSKAAQTYTPGTTNQTIAAGQYLSGNQTIAGSSNLTAKNIKGGVNIFGVIGTATTIDGTIVYNDTSFNNMFSFKPTVLSAARSSLAATTVGSYALFAGGVKSSALNNVDAYNTALTRTTPTKLSVARHSLAATTANNYALFGGGNNSNVVDAYDTSLTRTTPTVLSTTQYAPSAARVGSYALIGFGQSRNSSGQILDAYDSSLTNTMLMPIDFYREKPAATSLGNYALFGGGKTSSDNYYSYVVDAYNASLTRSTAYNLSAARHDLAATTVGSYALFGGGQLTIGTYDSANNVDVYNTSLTNSTGTALSQARHDLAATTANNYALFGGGYQKQGNSGYVSISTIDAYSTSLTRTTPTVLSAAKYNLAATTIGSYALFGGGINPATNVVDAITYAKKAAYYN